MRNTLILWCDLETTGIDPDAEFSSVLEASFQLCYQNGQPILEATTALHWPTSFPTEHIWKKHFETGLMKECQDDECTRSSDFDVQFATILEEQRVKHQAVIYLAGSSIHFDRSWIKKHLPWIDAELHYRMLDVRALIMFLEIQGVEFKLRSEEGNSGSKSEIHRAKADRDWAKRAYFRVVQMWSDMWRTAINRVKSEGVDSSALQRECGIDPVDPEK